MRILLSLLIVTLAEASIGIFVKLTGSQVPIFTLNFYRVFFAALFLLAAVPFFAKRWKFPKENAKDVLIVGALIALQISFFNVAMSLAPVANVVIFWSVAPFFVFIFSSIFLKEKPKPVHVLIFLVAIFGIFVAEPLSDGHALGNMIALIDGAVYAAMVTYLRHEGIEQQGGDIFWFMAAAAVILSPALLIFGPGDLLAMSANPLFGMDVLVLLWVACLGVISTGLAFLFISVVLKDIDANLYSLVDIIVSPVVAGVFAYLVFSEVPASATVYGGALLLVAGAWLTREMTRREPRKWAPKRKKKVIPKAVR